MLNPCYRGHSYNLPLFIAKMKKRWLLQSIVTLFCIASLPFCSIASAKFPEHALRLIVPFTPGGAVDSAARPAALGLGNALGQSVVVENKPGAGGTIGIQTVSRANPDGYTLLLGNMALASAPALYPNAGVDISKFAPIALIGSMPYVLLVKPNFPAKSVKQLIEIAKSKPGTLNYASAGSGSAIHLAGELFKSRAGVNIVHIPYKGASPATTALLGGDVDMMFSSIAEATPYLKDGKLRALAVTSASRAKDFPDIPTLEEEGVPDSEVIGWYGLYTQSDVPTDVLKTLQTNALKGLRSDATRQTLENYGLEVAKGDASEAKHMLESETNRWSQIIETAKIPKN